MYVHIYIYICSAAVCHKPPPQWYGPPTAPPIALSLGNMNAYASICMHMQAYACICFTCNHMHACACICMRIHTASPPPTHTTRWGEGGP